MHDVVTAEELRKIRQSVHFDAKWYLKAYPEVATLRLDPAVHYLRYGAAMRRDPGPRFSTSFFYDTQPEARRSGRNPLVWLAETGTVPEPNPDLVLWAASRVAMRGASERAVALARQHLPASLAYSARILEANDALETGQRAGWLAALNSYLDHFGVARLKLEGSGDLLTRLSTEPRPLVTGGPLVSVLMPAWNAERTLAMSARSILAQTWSNLELMIVDDCSTDDTWNVAQMLAAEDPRVRIFRNAANVGPYVSKNVAAVRAKGAWITGHDADDWAHPERLQRQVTFCRDNELSACMSGMLRVSGRGELVRLNPIGTFVHDGACRSGFISLMVSAQYFHDVLGSWDHVRAAGDSELIRRIEKVDGKPVEQLSAVTMLCLDNPEGLTNHATLGHSEVSGVSPVRKAYKRAYSEAHKGLTKASARLPFPGKRRFRAPPELLPDPAALSRCIEGHQKDSGAPGKHLDVDVALVTNLRFPGGTTSSSLDELHVFEANGLRIAIIHCPVDRDLGRPISGRYAAFADRITNWTHVEKLSARAVICRHPLVLTSTAFRSLAPKISTHHTFVVKNNSSHLAEGGAVYDIGAMVTAAGMVQSTHLTFCPISPVMRRELEAFEAEHGISLTLSEADWTPTFDASLYRHEPRLIMVPPFRIGRHGRDGPEKWHEDPTSLQLIYPKKPDFRIEILGGAHKARKILGSLPNNWLVHEFGDYTPSEYLSDLDAFVYFPHTALSEAFGRTIVEAMIAGVPVILPERFSETFGQLPLYCTPEEVEGTVRRLATDSARRISYLREVQEIAIQRYGRSAITTRLKAAGLSFKSASHSGANALSPEAQEFRESLLTRTSAQEELSGTAIHVHST
ncbi:glycosyltransferase (plasmid) [Roseivivax marinus]|uniref:glycosyltransferase n=1 Tax=Roseivivax marinus TaxID=1379903 RepID=UPI001F04732E|nr:glycosyltransferase [Roseivivax marinus]UMA67205.1 glycosyltransferase [Roseivivax marinus]